MCIILKSTENICSTTLEKYLFREFSMGRFRHTVGFVSDTAKLLFLYFVYEINKFFFIFV